MGYFGNPEDVAETVLFLVSERARFITGEIIDVNGRILMDYFKSLREWLGYFPSSRRIDKMESFRYSLPATDLIFGKGTLESVGTEAIEQLLEKIDLNIGLKDLRVEEEKFEGIAESAFATMKGSIEANPVWVTKEYILELYRRTI